MLGELLEKVLIKILKNYKKYLYGIIGFIIGMLIIKYGILKTMFVSLLTICGYLLGNSKLRSSIKERIINLLKK